ncbi:MAG: nucleotide sugar dehydrogenase [Bacteroidetes bacterium]|nr:nucleotide sugar dehydrogenase [Bacteroidota bacterium]
MYQDLLDGKAKLGVIGLGYVGLPIALEFAKRVHVIGFDINTKRICMMQMGIDPSKEVDESEFKGRNIVFTDNIDMLREVRFFVVAVPTPVDGFNIPDLKPVLGASETIGKIIKTGDYVVFESTVYPGCTEEDCLPIIERLSGLRVGTDFKLGYSPERINPGDKKNTLRNVVKIASGSDEVSTEEIAKTYELVVDAGVYRAPSIKVAEAAKIVENTQRDLNIALMNELSMIFDRMGINTYDVLEAAGTKWNFLKFSPGLVGGHCIGVDPYYLTHKAEALGYDAKVIAASRFINDNMARNVARKVIQHVLRNAQDANHARVLVKGVTFKEDVSDIRNSKIIDTVKEIQSFNIAVDIVDPFAQPDEVEYEYGLKLAIEDGRDYDAVIIATAHSPYKSLRPEELYALCRPSGLIADLKGIFKGQIKERDYWSL